MKILGSKLRATVEPGLLVSNINDRAVGASRDDAVLALPSLYQCSYFANVGFLALKVSSHSGIIHAHCRYLLRWGGRQHRYFRSAALAPTQTSSFSHCEEVRRVPRASSYRRGRPPEIPSSEIFLLPLRPLALRLAGVYASSSRSYSFSLRRRALPGRH